MSKLNTYRRRMKYLSVYAITKPRTAPSSRIPSVFHINQNTLSINQKQAYELHQSWHTKKTVCPLLCKTLLNL